MKTKEDNDPKKKHSLWDIIFRFLRGEILAEDFIVKQFKLVFMIVLLLFIFISNRYSCMKKQVVIETLTLKLKDVQYENLNISTELTTNSRQSQIEELLEEKNIKLSVSKSSVYEIHK
jgi:F0F1-type ATP synthase membrane subunit a